MVAYTPVGVHLNSGTDTFISRANQVFQTIYSDATGSGTTCSADPWSTPNSPWYHVAPPRTQYIWPRIIADPTVPKDQIFITNTFSSGAASTDSTFTITNPTWDTNVDITPANTWITVNNADLYGTSDAVNQMYHYILRFTGGKWQYADAAPEQRKATYRLKLKGQMFPYEKHRNDGPGDFCNVKENEIVALQLLKSMVSPERWKKYLKYGFVDVQAKSGLVYQILRKNSHVRVFRQGEKIADLCVGLKNRYEIPPTDEVITRMIIVECDEPDIWARANAHGFAGKKPKTEEDLARIVIQKAA